MSDGTVSILRKFADDTKLGRGQQSACWRTGLLLRETRTDWRSRLDLNKNKWTVKPSIWAVMIKDRASRSRRVIFHSSLAPVRPYLESFVKSGQLQHNKEGVYRKPDKILGGLGHRTCEERLGELMYLIRGYREAGSKTWGWLNTRTGCPRMLWNLHPSRCLRLLKTWV